MHVESSLFLAPGATIWFFGHSGTIESLGTPVLEQTNQPKRRLPAKTIVSKTVVLAAILAGLALTALVHPAEAAVRRHRAPPAGRITPMPAGATDPDKDAALIIDGATGKVLYARNETLERHPASLTKMMTLYLLFDALKNGKTTMQTQMPVSVHAQEQKPTKLSLRHGQTIDVDTAIRAIVIRSANDVAVVIAEALGGTESHFAQMMNEKARQLGMKETNYHNASGLPDPLQITTASDLAVLARHLAYDFPQYFPYFGTLGFTYKGTYYPTHDNLVGRYPGADGIKTGYVGASGFNLASSVVRDGAHLIGIVMGGRTAVRRDLEMMHLMDIEFAQIQTNPTLVAREQVPWMTVAQAAFTPPPKGFVLAPAAGNNNTQFASLSAVPAPLAADTDEDTAEAHRAPDENYNTLKTEAPQLASAATAPQPVPAASIPSVSGLPGPAVQLADLPALAAVSRQQPAMGAPKTNPAAAKPQVLAAAVPAIRPVLRPYGGEGDTDPGPTWSIQVGAYADQALARAQLDSFATKAKDIIGRAAHIVAPIQASNGHMIYRARFGPYAEREAHAVCSQLTQRGQSCFAVVTR
jgi:D-alanyl-D-alanine carboxypeptidase